MNYEKDIADLYKDFQQVFTYVDDLTVGKNIGLEPYDFEQFGELVTGADVDIVPVQQHNGISDEVLYMATLWATDAEWGIIVEDTPVRVVQGDVSVVDAVNAVETLDDSAYTVFGDQVDRTILVEAATATPRTIYILTLLAPLFTTIEG